MAKQYEQDPREQTLAGMDRAFAHAIDMNKNGEIEAEEVEEFRRYIIGEALGQLGMDDYLAMRESGEIDKFRKMARYPEGVDSHAGQRSREEIARKIAASFADRMYEDGHMQDHEYATAMRSLGMEPDDLREKRERTFSETGKDPGDADAAMAMWDRGGLPGPEESDDSGGHGMPLSEQYLSPPVQELSAEDVAEFQSRQKKRT